MFGYCLRKNVWGTPLLRLIVHDPTKAIIWTNAGILLIENLVGIQTISLKNALENVVILNTPLRDLP